jgi:AcrR family transcriptional regulator
MTPRPRSISDEQILAATARVIGRIGPHRLTLAAVGTEAGLAAATLVQRFGSKRELLLAVARSGAGSASDHFGAIRAAHGSALDSLLEAMACMGRMARTPEEMSNHLAFLQMDLRDPEFHELTADYFRLTLDAIAVLLDEAVAAGEIGRVDTVSLARAVQSMANGALLNWAIHRDGPAVDAIRTDLRLLLAPYRRVTKSGRRGAGGETDRRAG